MNPEKPELYVKQLMEYLGNIEERLLDTNIRLAEANKFTKTINIMHRRLVKRRDFLSNYSNDEILKFIF